MRIGLSLLCFALLIGLASADVVINEVMYDLNGTDTNREWIEVYNNGSTTINLTGWKFYEASTKHTLTLLNGSMILFAGNYSVIIQDIDSFVADNPNFTGTLFDSSFDLSNSGEELGIWNGTNHIFNITYNTSIGANGDGKSLQFYNNSWQACTPTPGTQNNCTIPAVAQNLTCNYTSSCSASWSTCANNIQNKTCLNSTTTTNCSNLTYYITQSCTTPSSTPEVYIELEWNEDDIINGDEFEIDVNAFNLQSGKYDIKIWIQDSEDKIMSERYDEESDEWKSGTYYVSDFFSGSGNKTDTIKLRIKSDDSDFSGDADLYGRIRESGSSGSEDDIDYSIEILEASQEEDSGSEIDSNSDTNVLPPTNDNSNNKANSQSITLNTISLGSPSNGTVEKDNSIIYKSKTEYIKEYAPYFFGVVCIFIITILIIDKIR
jgi:hypothetical protein